MGYPRSPVILSRARDPDQAHANSFAFGYPDSDDSSERVRLRISSASATKYAHTSSLSEPLAGCFSPLFRRANTKSS